MIIFIFVFGGFCFIICLWYLVKDREVVEECIRVNEDESFLLGLIVVDIYIIVGDENQVLRNDESFDDERDVLIVFVDVYGVLLVYEKLNSFLVI